VPIRSTTRGPANSFIPRKVAGVAKGIAPQRQTEKPEHRKTYQNLGQKQGPKPLGQRPPPLAKRVRPLTKQTGLRSETKQ
tara:strand:- start:2782 stop:3021 length:240 start_codon:yes stop_codon:yes gene_type:complete